MKVLELTVLVCLVACAIGVPSVVRFTAGREHTPARRLKFKFGTCLNKSKEMAVVKSISMLPDPLVFPGPLNVSFSVNFKDTVDSPLKAELYLAKQVNNAWVKVPCVGMIGSCTYEDLCQILSMIGECPQPFIDAGVPCMCPFKKGVYTLPPTNFDVEVAVLPAGNYRAQANLSVNNNIVGCYNLTATFG